MPEAGNHLRTRIHQAISDTWPALPGEAVSTVGFDVARLAELLRETLGYDPDTALTEARTAILGALLPAGTGDAGWVEVLPVDGEAALARGQLHLHDAAPDASGARPTGALVHLRSHEERSSLAAGPYRIRFETSGETHAVTTVTDQGVLMPDVVALVFLNEELPATVQELSEGE